MMRDVSVMTTFLLQGLIQRTGSMPNRTEIKRAFDCTKMIVQEGIEREQEFRYMERAADEAALARTKAL